MSEIDRLKKKSARIEKSVSDTIAKLTKASKAEIVYREKQSKAFRAVEMLSEKASKLSAEKSRLDAMIAAGTKAEAVISLSADGKEGGGDVSTSPSPSDDMPTFLNKK